MTRRRPSIEMPTPRQDDGPERVRAGLAVIRTALSKLADHVTDRLVEVVERKMDDFGLEYDPEQAAMLREALREKTTESLLASLRQELLVVEASTEAAVHVSVTVGTSRDGLIEFLAQIER